MIWLDSICQQSNPAFLRNTGMTVLMNGGSNNNNKNNFEVLRGRYGFSFVYLYSGFQVFGFSFVNPTTF